MTPTEAQVERLYNEHAALVFRRCRRILGNEEAAHDATHEVFARAIRSWDRFDGDSSRLTWICRIATNHCLNEVRNRSGHRQKLAQRKGEAPGAGSGPPGHSQVEINDLVRVVMQDMPEDLQRLAVLYYFDEMTQAEIAREVGLSVPTVRKRLRRFIDEARHRIRRGFESQLLQVSATALAVLLTLGWLA